MGQKAKSAGKKKVTQGGVGGAMVADKPVVSEGLQSKVDLSSAIEPLTHAVSHVEENTAGNRVELNKQLRHNLASYWKEYGIDFALFWLMMSPEDREAFVKSVVPDIKMEQSTEDPTDLLLPELNMGVLQAQMGRGLVAVMQTRASLEGSVEVADLNHCKKLDQAGQMPIFSGMEVSGTEGDAFEGVLAFVLDDGRVVVCDNDRSAEEKAKSRRMIADGSVKDANQFITTNVRRTALLQFCCGIADKYLEKKGIKPGEKVDKKESIDALGKVIENVSKLQVEEKTVVSVSAEEGKSQADAGLQLDA